MSENIFMQIRRFDLYREPDVWVSGVCSGIARKFRVDVTIVRAVLAASVLLTGVGVVLYGVAWLVMPERRTGHSLIERLTHGDFNVQVIPAVAAYIIGSSRGDLYSFSGDWLTSTVSGICFIGLVAVFVIGLVQRSNSGTTPLPHPVPPTPPSPHSSASYWTADSTPAWTQPASADDQRNTVDSSQSPDPGSPTTSATSTPPEPEPAQPTTPALKATMSQDWAGWTEGKNSMHSDDYTAPYRSPLPPPVAPAAPVPVVGRPGARVFGAAFGLLMVTVALAIAYQGTVILPAQTVLAIIGGALALTGVAIIIYGILGRSSGSLSGFAVLTGIAGIIAAGVYGVAGIWGGPIADNVLWAPSAEETFADYSVGDLTVDLRHINPDDVDDVTASLGIGQMTVIIPDDVNVEVDYKVGIGQFDSSIDRGEREVGGLGFDGMLIRADSDDAETIHLTVEVGIGSLQLENQY